MADRPERRAERRRTRPSGRGRHDRGVRAYRAGSYRQTLVDDAEDQQGNRAGQGHRAEDRDGRQERSEHAAADRRRRAHLDPRRACAVVFFPLGRPAHSQSRAAGRCHSERRLFPAPGAPVRGRSRPAIRQPRPNGRQPAGAGTRGRTHLPGRPGGGSPSGLGARPARACAQANGRQPQRVGIPGPAELRADQRQGRPGDEPQPGSFQRRNGIGLRGD